MLANQQIVFIDSQVADYQLLASGVLPGIEVVILTSNKPRNMAESRLLASQTQLDSISQITKALSQKPYSTVHIVSHGSPGCLYLGNTQLSLDTLNTYQSELKTWFSSSSFIPYPLSLLIYGCNVAAGDAGEEFINKLHNITGTKIAASTTPIGNANLGGNWDLEYQTGNVTLSSVFTSKVQDEYAGILEEDNPLAPELTEDLVEDIATITTDLDDYAPGSTATITGENFEPGETVELQILHTDGTPNTGGGHDPWQVTDGSADDLDGEVNGTIITTWFVNPDDSGGSAFELTATGLNSGKLANHYFTDSDPAVQFFYVPAEEEDILDAIQAFATNTESNFNTATAIDTVVSITVSTDDSIIYYDHWEDGYEADPNNPTQSSTEVWGDNNPDNGIAPGFSTDVLSSGDVIALENSVIAATTSSVVDYDGRDKVGASKAIVISRAAWPTQNSSADSSGTLIGGSVEVYDTSKWGTEYKIPIGENFTSSLNFEYTSIFITASTDGTTLTLNGADVDINGDTVIDSSDVLDEGETYFVDDVNFGDAFVASNPIQAQLLTGDINSRFASRSYTLLPTSEWSNSYYTPVGKVDTDSNTDVFLYNPDASGSITVRYETATTSGDITLDGGEVERFSLPLDADSGAHFYTDTTTDEFWAITAFDSEDSAHDWGFSLVPENNLTPTIQVGWGLGNGNTDENGNPLWVMATEATTLYVDYDGDGVAPNTDINGGQYDDTISIGALESVQITDTLNNDFDQSGIRVYTVDGTNLAGAWGQNPNAATAGTSLDLGTTVLPLPVATSWKTSDLVTGNNANGDPGDFNGDGNVDPGDTIEYTINIQNDGVVVLGNVNVSDIVPDGTTYVPGSKTVNGVAVGDDANGTTFPLDDDGLDNGIDDGRNIGNIQPGESGAVSFQVTVNDPYDGSIDGVTNSANVDSDEDSFTVAVNTPIDLSGVETKTLYLSDTNDLDRIDPTNSDPVDDSDSESSNLTVTSLVGIDFDNDTNGNSSPNNWNVLDFGDDTLGDNESLINENGVDSGYELALDVLGSGNEWTGNPSNTSTLPSDLDGAISDNIYDGTGINATWSGLDSSTTYNVYVFSLDAGNGDTSQHEVTITGNTTETFTISYEDDELYVNNTIGSSLTSFKDGAIPLTPNGSDEISIEVDQIANFASLGGLAIQPVTDNSETFTQSIPMRDSFTIDADGTVSITAYIDMSSGTPDTNSDIVATLEYGSNNIATLSNPTSVEAYDSGDGRTDVYKVTWITTLASDTTIASGESVNLEITNNDSDLDFTVLYDSATYPSKIDLPTASVIDITNIGIYDASGDGNGTLITEATGNDPVYLRVTVTDPFGEDDITSLELVITDPSGSKTTVNSSQIIDVDGTADDNTKVYEYTFTPTSNLGDYTFDVTANEGFEGTVKDIDSTTLRLKDTIAPDVIIGDSTVTEGTELVFDVTLSGTTSSTSDIVLDLAATTETGNTATEIGDYETRIFEYSIDGGTTWISAAGTNSTQVTIPGGSSGIKVRIDSVSDATDEPDETFTLEVNRVVNGSVGDTSDTGTGTILDDDAAPSVSIDDVTIVEGNTAQKELTFTVTLDNPSSQSITVNYATTDGTAEDNTPEASETEDDDYVAKTGAITFAPGETSKTITVNTKGDTDVELDETFDVDLTVASGSVNNVDVTSSDLQGVGTILNDDDTPIFEINDVTIVEGNVDVNGDSEPSTLEFTVTRSGDLTVGATVDFATANNTATTGNNDYEATSGTLTFAAVTNPTDNQIQTQEISVTINGDLPPELDETFFVNLFNADNTSTPADNDATISDAQGIGTIVNDDASGTISGNVQADTNNDDTADTPLSGVTIELLDTDGNSIDSDSATAGVQPTTTTTDANGDYQFTNVEPNNYLIRETDLTGYTSVSDGDSTNSNDDDAFLPNTNTNDNLIPVTLSANEVDNGNDFVDEQTGSISGEALADTNNDDIGDSPLKDVTIELLDGNGGSIDSNPDTAGVQPTTITTDANGGYSFTDLAPGDYRVKQTNLSSYGDVKDLDTNVNDTANGTDGITNKNLIDVSLSTGQNSTGNDFVDERATISGNVKADTSDPSDTTGDEPLANVTIELLDSSGDSIDSDSSTDGVQPTTTTTDANGNYSFFDLEPATYIVEETDLSGYDSVIDNDETDDDGGVGGIDNDDNTANTNDNQLTIALAAGEDDTGNNFVDRAQPGTISGKALEDTTGDGLGDTPLAGVTVHLRLNDGSTDNIATQITDSNGEYSFTDLSVEDYKVVQLNLTDYDNVDELDSVNNGTNDGEQESVGGTTDRQLIVDLATNEADTGNDFVLRAETGIISGTVKADTTGDGNGDTNLENITVSLRDNLGNPILNSSGVPITDDTDSNGVYEFTDVAPGDYLVVESDPDGYSSVKDEDSTADGTADDATNTNTNDNTLAVNLLPGETDDGNDFVDQQNGSISGKVEADTNNDNTGDSALSGVTVDLKDSGGNTVATNTTDNNGNYSFSDVTPGDYTIVETDLNDYSSVKDGDETPDGGNDGETNNTGTNNTNDNIIAVSLKPNESDTGNNFVDKLNTATGTISGKVEEDNAGNDDGDVPISGVTIKLFNQDGTVEIDSTTTNASGDYTFNNVTIGTVYQVKEVNNSGFGDVKDIDSNNDNNITVDLTSTSTSTGNDFVDAQVASIAGRIWADANSDGLDNNSEAGINGLTVTLIGGGADGDIGTGDDDTSVTATTANNGSYSFTGLNPGEEYQVTFPTSATGYSGLTAQDINSNGNNTIDSDADVGTGKTDVLILSRNEDRLDIDAGLLESAAGTIEGTNVSETLPGTGSGETIAGLKGQDTLTGNGGEDTFFFNETSEGVDVITDFNNSGSDKVDLRTILANEVPLASNTNLFNDGYVLFTQYSNTVTNLGTMVQIDFDGSAGELLPKSVVLLQGDDVADLNTTAIDNNPDFLFF